MSTSQTFCSEWVGRYLIDVDVELSQTMENKFALIDEDLRLILQKLLAVLLHFLRHGRTEHQHLLVVGGLDEDILNIRSHFGVAQYLIALINNEELALNHIRITF